MPYNHPIPDAPIALSMLPRITEPQGMPYINLLQDAVYGDFNATSYPNW